MKKQNKNKLQLDKTAACQYGEITAVTFCTACISTSLPLEGGGGPSVEDCQKSSGWFEEMISLKTRTRKTKLPQIHYFLGAILIRLYSTTLPMG